MPLPPLPPSNLLAKLAKRNPVENSMHISWKFYEKLRLEFKGTASARKRSHNESGEGSPVKKQAKMEDVGSQKMKKTPNVAEQENINSASLSD